MARKRASMREGPLAELFRATEAARRRDRAAGGDGRARRRTGRTGSRRSRASSSRADPAEPLPPEPDPAPPPAPRAGAARSRAAASGRRARLGARCCPSPCPRLHLAPRSDASSYLAVIRVVGVGGAGLNAINRMIDAGVNQVEFVAVNTDMQQLRMSEAPTKIHIGRELTQGLGSGADPEVGRKAARGELRPDRSRRCAAPTWSSSPPARAAARARARRRSSRRIARELGALTVGIVTMPFRFEGTRRRAQADDGVVALREACDTVIVIPNDRLLEVLDRSTSMLDAFRIADDVLRQGVQGITDLITMPGLINLDFADVRTIMSDAGSALMGIGFSSGGDDRAREAAERALARR